MGEGYRTVTDSLFHLSQVFTHPNQQLEEGACLEGGDEAEELGVLPGAVPAGRLQLSDC